MNWAGVDTVMNTSASERKGEGAACERLTLLSELEGAQSEGVVERGVNLTCQDFFGRTQR